MQIKTENQSGVDVSKMLRPVNKTIVLGSGVSVNKLSKEEIDHINQCKIVIAINKYMAFYKIIGIIPTHVYFLDVHENSLRFLEFIFKVCREDKITGLTFFLRTKVQDKLYSNVFKKLWRLFINPLKFTLARIKNRNILSRSFLGGLRGSVKLIHYPRQNKLIFTTYEHFMKGGKWSDNLTPMIYHFRGSLSSVLNICGILSKDTPIYLIGTDFNSSEYFFEKELSALNFDTSDYTTPIIKDQGRHFSVVEHDGTTMLDRLPFMVDQLKKNGNDLYCANEESLLVKKGFVPYKNILDE
jgi:hypothetical protein